jgi:NDP-sugar pyrophosphorylase family protein
MPKALVSVCGEPALARKLVWLSGCGYDRIAVNTHYMADRIDAFRRSAPYRFTIFHEQPHILGTAGALYNCASFLAHDDVSCVCNVDIIADVHMPRLITRFLEMDALCAPVVVTDAARPTIAYDAHTHAFAGLVDAQDTESTAHTRRGFARGAFIGITLYRRDFFRYLTARDFSITDVWQRLAARGTPVRVLEHPPCYWRDIGTPDALAAIHHDVLQARLYLSPPEWLVLDTAACRAYPRGMPVKDTQRLRAGTWYEPGSLPAGTRVSRSVVMRGACLPAHTHVENGVWGVWGELRLG